MYQYGQMYLISSIQTTNNTKHPTYYNQHHDSPTQCSLMIVISRLPYRVSTPQSRPGQMHDHAIWWGPSWSGYNRKQPEHWTNSKPNSNPNHRPNKYQTDQFQNYLTSIWNTNRTNINPIRTDPYILSSKIFHSGWFQNFKIQNFLQPWWKNSRVITNKFIYFGGFKNIRIQNHA